MIRAEVLDALLAAGATAEQIVAAVKADAAVDEARKASKRENNAERQRRFKARKTRNNAANALVGVSARCAESPPPNDIYSNPPPEPQPPTVAAPLSEIDTVVLAWNEMAKRTGLGAVRQPLEGSRVAKLRARIKVHGLKGALDAVAAVERSPWCRGEVKDWKADFKFFLQPESFTKLLEGGFEPKAATPIGRAPARPMNAAELRSAIAFAEDNGDQDRAAELKRQLANAMGWNGPAAQVVADAAKSLSAGAHP